jgi:hypothetical protein
MSRDRRAFIRRSIAAVLLVSMGLSNTGYAAGNNASATGRRLRLHIESGGLVGAETVDIANYSAVNVRFFAATGLKAMVFPRDSLAHSLESVGLEYSVAIGNQKEDKWEARHAVGPAVTWRLDEKWRLHNMVGFVWSSERGKLDRGIQLRNYISYKDGVSLDIIYQTLPAVSGYEQARVGSVSSLYMGLVLHGKPGVLLLLGAGVVTIIGAIILLAAMVEGLSHLG